MCEGDARRALNALEIAVLTTSPGPDGVVRVTRAAAEDSIQRKAVVYDHDEDGHYDTISAFIKSVRGPIPMPPCTGWPRCCTRARTRGSSPAAS